MVLRSEADLRGAVGLGPAGRIYLLRARDPAHRVLVVVPGPPAANPRKIPPTHRASYRFHGGPGSGLVREPVSVIIGLGSGDLPGSDPRLGTAAHHAAARLRGRSPVAPPQTGAAGYPT